MISRIYIILWLLHFFIFCHAIDWNTEIFPMATSLGILKQPKPYDIQESVNYAQKLYQNNEIDMENEEKLAIMIVFNFDLTMNGTHPRFGSLVCAINKIYQNIAIYTPIDIYVWFNNKSISLIPIWFIETFPNLRIMPIDNRSWQLHENEYSSFSQWTYGSYYSLNYHLMGHWRLTYAFDFIYHMKYQYMLQIDDDTFIIENINYNIIHRFRENNIAYAYRNRIIQEEQVAVLGLAEIVKFWMRSRNYLHPKGPLYTHFHHTTTNTNIEYMMDNVDDIHSASWNRHIVGASFMLFDLNFWFSLPVQDFVEFVTATGAHLTQRWLEQGVINMIHLLFLSTEYVYLFPQSVAVHQKVYDVSIFRLLECDRVVHQMVDVDGDAGTSSKLTLTLSGIEEMPFTITSSTSSSDGSSSTTSSNIDSTHSNSIYNTIEKVNNTIVSIDKIHTVEFLVIWQLHAVRGNTEELTLFKWKYNSNLASCGVDTAILNDYMQYKDAILHNNFLDLLILPELWMKYHMDNKLNTLLTYTPIVIEDTVSVIEEAKQCRIVLLQQLYDYVEFYTIGMGATSLHSVSLQGMYDSILLQADRLFNSQFPPL